MDSRDDPEASSDPATRLLRAIVLYCRADRNPTSGVVYSDSDEAEEFGGDVLVRLLTDTKSS